MAGALVPPRPSVGWPSAVIDPVAVGNRVSVAMPRRMPNVLFEHAGRGRDGRERRLATDVFGARRLIPSRDGPTPHFRPPFTRARIGAASSTMYASAPRHLPDVEPSPATLGCPGLSWPLPLPFGGEGQARHGRG
jgi:hypothetical protein